MYLKRVPPKSLPKPCSLENCFSDETRLARTPPSTFLFLPIHFSNSPGIMAIPLSGRTEECRTSAHPRTVGCFVTVPVRSFGGTSSHRGAVGVPNAVYREAYPSKSTTNQLFLHRHRADLPIGAWLSTERLSGEINRCAALKPYS